MLRFPIVAVLGLAAPGGVAQDNFPPLTAWHLASETIAKLKAHGIVVTAPKHGVGNGPMQPEEAKEALEQGLQSLEAFVRAVNEDLELAALLPGESPLYQSVMAERTAHRESLQRLKTEGLLRDLKGSIVWLRGLIDAPSFHSRVESLSREIDGRSIPRTLAWSEDRIPDIPENHWFYEKITDAGVVGKFMLFHSGLPNTAENLNALLFESLQKRPTTWQRAVAGYLAARELRGHVRVPHDQSWKRLLTEIAWRSQRTKRTLFSDVPAGHWAGEAVRKMREQGVFVGDGGRRFRGGG